MVNPKITLSNLAGLCKVEGRATRARARSTRVDQQGAALRNAPQGPSKPTGGQRVLASPALPSEGLPGPYTTTMESAYRFG